MKILFYSPSADPSGDKLKQSVDEVVDRAQVEVHRQVTGLVQRLRMPSSDLEMAIIMPANRHELFAVSPLLAGFQGIRLVLVLPDREDETIAMAHSLRPRFVTYSNGDYSELKEVVKKMLSDLTRGGSSLPGN